MPGVADARSHSGALARTAVATGAARWASPTHPQKVRGALPSAPL